MPRVSIWRVVLAIVALILVLQLVPYGRNHTNPPVRQEPPWDSPRTRELTVRTCFACHSNETDWPWYSNVAPASWLIQHDVDEGRSVVNYSEWDRPQPEAPESAEAFIEGSMPPWYYEPLHPEARLTPVERDELIQGLTATFGREE